MVGTLVLVEFLCCLGGSPQWDPPWWRLRTTLPFPFFGGTTLQGLIQRRPIPEFFSHVEICLWVDENEKNWVLVWKYVFMFIPIWENDPSWRIFFRWVENHQLENYIDLCWWKMRFKWRQCRKIQDVYFGMRLRCGGNIGELRSARVEPWVLWLGMFWEGWKCHSISYCVVIVGAATCFCSSFILP